MFEGEVRVRFAPSPTGPFHIGGARSALFNWLLARKTKGKLILRVEDTDLERSTKESEENIKNALRWLGLDWDEGVDVGGPYGPYRQTERLATYEQYTKRLLESGQAYYCYCSDEELETERQSLLAKGEMPRYMGKCRHLTEQQKNEFIKQGRKPTVRFKVPQDKQIVVDDLVRGEVSFDSNGIGDFVIVKSDGIPTYNYAVVIDDALMKISHVIRAEEHLSNTPRQILVYEALGFTVPRFGHISLILGKDRTKMSKRHGATSVDQYRQLGYLPEALVNFLALLGWSPVGEQEMFSLEELMTEFSTDRLAKNPAVFDIDKLNWINAHYIRQISPDRLLELAVPHLQQAGYIDAEISDVQREWLIKVLLSIQEHISYAAQVVDHAAVYFNDEIVFENQEAKDVLADPTVMPVLESFKKKLTELEVLDAQSIQGLLKSIIKELKVNGKKVYMPIRVAITGNTHGPELTNIIPLVGKERVLARLATTLAKI